MLGCLFLIDEPDTSLKYVASHFHFSLDQLVRSFLEFFKTLKPGSSEGLLKLPQKNLQMTAGAYAKSLAVGEAILLMGLSLKRALKTLFIYYRKRESD